MTRQDLHGRARALRWAIFLVAAVSLTAACESEGEHRSVTKLVEASDLASEGDPRAPRISQELMLALAQAKNFHHRAKVYMSDGNPTEAMASVRQILSLRFPAGAPEAEDVRADARALLAKLMIGRGELEEAARVVEEGLANATRDSFFIANLYTVKGEVHEAMAHSADKSGAGQAVAAEHRREAIRAFDRSIEINSAIQQRLVQGATP